MAASDLIIGIDIGNSKIRTVIAVKSDERGILPNIIGVGVSPSSGLRKGAIVDIGETIAAITASLEDAERMAGEPIHHAFISAGGSHLAAQNSNGVIAVGHAGHEITPDDVARALEAAQAVSIPQNRQILRTIPQVFRVDGQNDVKDPVGMMGVRMEVQAHIITGLSPALKNLESAVHQSGVDVDDFVPTPLAAAESVLNKRQKELGVVVIDIGAGSTSLAVLEEGIVLASAVLPIGGDNVSNDVAIGLRTSVETAEKLKIEHGSVQIGDFSDRDTVDLAAISRSESQVIGKRELAEIIHARYSEILDMVQDELKAIERNGQLPAGAVLTGGAAKIPGLLELARNQLGLPVQIGFPTGLDGMIDRIDDPSFATVTGLIRYGVAGPRQRGFSVSSFQTGKLVDGVKDFFKKLLP